MRNYATNGRTICRLQAVHRCAARCLEEPSGGDLARRDVPTCQLEDDLQQVRERVRALGWDTCMVINEHGIVLGRLGRKALRADIDQTVEEAMTEGRAPFARALAELLCSSGYRRTISRALS